MHELECRAVAEDNMGEKNNNIYIYIYSIYFSFFVVVGISLPR